MSGAWFAGGAGRPRRVPPHVAEAVSLAGRMAVTERALDAANRRHLLIDGENYAARIRRSTCGTLTCTYRAVGLVHGIPMCGTCGDALTAITHDHGDDDR